MGNFYDLYQEGVVASGIFQQNSSSWMNQISMSNQAVDSIAHQIKAYKKQFGASPEHDGVALMMSPQTHKAIQSDYPHVVPYPFGKVFGLKVYQEHGMKPGEVYLVLTKGLPWSHPSANWGKKTSINDFTSYVPPGIYADELGPQLKPKYEGFTPYPKGLEFVKSGPLDAASSHQPQVIYEAPSDHYVLIDSNLKQWKLTKEFVHTYDGPKPPISDITVEGWKVVTDFHYTMETTHKPIDHFVTPYPKKKIVVTNVHCEYHDTNHPHYSVTWNKSEGYNFDADYLKALIDEHQPRPEGVPPLAWIELKKFYLAHTIKTAAAEKNLLPKPKKKKKGDGTSIVYDGAGVFILYQDNELVYKFTESYIQHKIDVKHTSSKCDDYQWKLILKAYEDQLKTKANLNSTQKVTKATPEKLVQFGEFQIGTSSDIPKGKVWLQDGDLKMILVKDAYGHHYQACSCDSSPVDCKAHNPPKLTADDLVQAVKKVKDQGEPVNDKQGTTTIKVGDVGMANVGMAQSLAKGVTEMMTAKASGGGVTIKGVPNKLTGMGVASVSAEAMAKMKKDFQKKVDDKLIFGLTEDEFEDEFDEDDMEDDEEELNF